MTLEIAKLIFGICGFILGDYISTKIPSGETELQKTYYTLLKILIIVLITSASFISAFFLFK